MGKNYMIIIAIMVLTAAISGCSTEEGNVASNQEVISEDDAEPSTEEVTESTPVNSEGVDERYNIYHVGDTIDLWNTDNEKEKYTIEVTDVYTTTDITGDDALVVEMIATNTGTVQGTITSGTVYADDFELKHVAVEDKTDTSANLPPGRKAKLYNTSEISNPDQYKKLELQLGTNIVVDLKPALVVESKSQDTAISESDEDWLNNGRYEFQDEYYHPDAENISRTETWYPAGTDGYVNIRSGPGTEYPIVDSLENGSNCFNRTIDMYEDSKWIEVEVYSEDGILHGYVAKSQVTKATN